MSVKLIVGLGNPGSEYENTRHNAGALFVSHLCNRFSSTLRPDKKFHGRHGKIIVDGKDVHLLEPTTFMNRSGLAVQALANYFNLQPEQILVAHDELDLPCGSVKLKTAGGHGGHNGLRDIIRALQGEKGFHRLRLGIGHPGSKEKVIHHVLGKLSRSEMQLLEEAFDEAARTLPLLIQGDIARAMNRINSYKPAQP